MLCSQQSGFQFNFIFFLLVVGCLHLGKFAGSVLCRVFYSYGKQKRLSFHTRSSLALKAFTEVAVTTSSGSVFQSLMTLRLNASCLIFVEHLRFEIFRRWPLADEALYYIRLICTRGLENH